MVVTYVNIRMTLLGAKRNISKLSGKDVSLSSIQHERHFFSDTCSFTPPPPQNNNVLYVLRT